MGDSRVLDSEADNCQHEGGGIIRLKTGVLFQENPDVLYSAHHNTNFHSRCHGATVPSKSTIICNKLQAV
jgi:hypothetical protein